MNEVLLRKELGTQYLTTYFSNDILKLFEEYKNHYIETGEKVTVDISKCKFNPENHYSLIKYCDYVDFIDSENPIIDSILQHNKNVSKMRQLIGDNIIQIENIPHELDPKEILTYLNKLDPKKIYRLKSFNELNGRSPDVSILIAILISCLHPEIQIDLTEQTSNYFRIFKKFWTYSECIKRDSYNLQWQNNIIKITAIKVDNEGNNIFYVPGTGEIREDILNKSYNVIPFDFGTKTLQELREDLELKDIFEDAAKELTRIASKKERKKKLKDELSVLERRK